MSASKLEVDLLNFDPNALGQLDLFNWVEWRKQCKDIDRRCPWCIEYDNWVWREDIEQYECQTPVSWIDDGGFAYLCGVTRDGGTKLRRGNY